MIRLDDISKQRGHQIFFIDASMSSMDLFAPLGEADMMSAPGPIRASQTDRRSDRSCP
jgi:hypothetical protein